MWVPQGFAYLPKAWRLPLPLAGTLLPLRKGKSCPPLLGITAQLCGCTRLTHDRNVRNSFCFWSNTCKIWVSLKVTWKWESFWSLWNPFLNQTLDLKCQVTWELLMNDKCVFFFFLRFYDLISSFLSGCVHPALLHLHFLWLHILFSGSLVCMTPKYSFSAAECVSLAFPKEMHFSDRLHLHLPKLSPCQGQLCNTTTNNSESCSDLPFTWREMRTVHFV